MEHFIYLAIKGLSAVYILRSTAKFLFGEKVEKLWRFLYLRTVETESYMPKEKIENGEYSVIGKSSTEYLEKQTETKSQTPAPFLSEDLETVSSVEEEPDITDSDVEANLEEDIPEMTDRFIPLDVEPDDGSFSTGMTYDQIFSTLDVVQGRKTGKEDCEAAARILYEVHGSDVFNFLATQAENEVLIERLLRENIDDEPERTPRSAGKKHQDIEEFTIDKYV